MVLKCRNKVDGSFVALKKFKHCEEESDRRATMREGTFLFVSFNTYRECFLLNIVKMLRLLAHPNVVHLIEGFRRKVL